jgi:hypothetical protein
MRAPRGPKSHCVQHVEAGSPTITNSPGDEAPDRRIWRAAKRSKFRLVTVQNGQFGTAHYGSADEAVGAVRVLDEVLGVPAGTTALVLRKEHAIGVVGPPRTSQPDVIGPEALGQFTTGHRAAYVLNEPAHGSSVAA